MKENFGFYSSLLFSLLFCVLLFDSILLLTGRIHHIPGSHRQVLLIGLLLWVILLFLGSDRDDDWAGQR
ncbi:hypothetical protein DIU31_003125 [Mucilaginibacter rubeus]|uniref:Uncharacterized protein n=1 Tax=Mucilaginibacter rubeus TaxID=2027860 RepID=A0AAE6MGV2_9SPHI|nr:MULTISPECIES: hypothetical protein [Mucilaginibacter]QEM02557.1 hypothetical protein DIU31_003125 [Mucilaginibacter rubeus]QEM15177.1 hypothetical protein DIU38_003155 [Mucilaginibacter gossypii]QTE42099.1 hypothetical protein J3L19_24650 [Mucilaginibacter rubeus]QTE48700.1 hypothetical protein J3L21_24625 [Mucilaginibacter rubeus]QTE60085.1 hypothetical protein J3L23_16255 [Mucilaginibacter rubeus]